MTLTIPRPVKKVFDRFAKADLEIFLIGAGSRNLLQGKKPVDCDFTTNAVPEEILKLYPHGFYDNIYGTVGIPLVGVSGEQEIYEVTTYRTEGEYQDRRRPAKVYWGEKLEEDLARRDFTINAVAIGPRRQTGPQDLKAAAGEIVQDDQGQELEIIDLFGGRKDLDQKLLRAVGNPDDRFQEDALRLMRAVRIASQLEFVIEEATFAAIKRHAKFLTEIAGERVRDELIKILASKHPADAILLLFNSGLLEILLPELTAGYGIEQTGHHQDDIFTHSINSLKHCPSPDPLVRLATLLHDIGKVPTRGYLCQHCQFVFTESKRIGSEVVCPECGLSTDEHQATTFYNHEVVGARMVAKIADRLRLSKKQKERLVTLVRWHQFSVDEHQTDKAIRRFIRRVGKENLQEIIDLRVGDRVGGGTPPTSWRLEKFLARIEEVQKQPFGIADLKIDGHQVMDILNLKPGPKVGEALRRLFAEVEEDLTKNTRQYLTTRLKEISQE